MFSVEQLYDVNNLDLISKQTDKLRLLGSQINGSYDISIDDKSLGIDKMKLSLGLDRGLGLNIESSSEEIILPPNTIFVDIDTEVNNLHLKFVSGGRVPYITIRFSKRESVDRLRLEIDTDRNIMLPDNIRYIKINAINDSVVVVHAEYPIYNGQGIVIKENNINVGPGCNLHKEACKILKSMGDVDKSEDIYSKRISIDINCTMIYMKTNKSSMIRTSNMSNLYNSPRMRDFMVAFYNKLLGVG